MAPRGKKKENLSILEEIYNRDDKNTKNQSAKSAQDGNQKRTEALLAGAILFLGLGAIVLGFFQLKNQLSGPFAVKNAETETQTDQADLLGLKQKDTDQDGLSDYDELYLYSSSPYLPDTDSDGIDDAKEAARGSDPNCPEGQNCFAVWGVEALADPTQKEDSTSLFSSGFDPDQLRQILIEAGVNEADLAQLSDEDLIATYQQVLAESQTEPTEGATTITLPTSNVEDLTPDQIRELLKQAGIASDVLDKISDQELMTLVEETLASQSNQNTQTNQNTNQNINQDTNQSNQ